MAQDDGVTSVNTPILRGTAEAGVLVRVDVDGTVYETEADASGEWEIGLDELADGEYVPVITTVDAAGNESDPVEGAVLVIDTEAPSDGTAELVHDEDNDTGSDSEDNITNNNAPTISGETEPLARVMLEIDGQVHETEADEDGYWEITVDALSDGEHTPVITVTDVAGNVSEPMEGTPLIVDTTPPEPGPAEMVHDQDNDTGASSTDGITANDSPVLRGIAQPGAIVRVDVGGEVFETEADDLGRWEISADGLSDDTHVPLVTVLDVAGNESEAVEGESFTVDTEAPDAGSHSAFLTPLPSNDTGLDPEDFITSQRAPLLSGTADALVQVRVVVGDQVHETMSDEDGNWQVQLTALDDGEYTPLLTTTDAAGNVSDESEGDPFVIDTQAPQGDDLHAALLAEEDNDTGVSSTDGITNVNAPTLSGITEPLAMVRVRVAGQVHEVQAEDDGTWSVTLDELPDGVYRPLIEVTDVAGNTSETVAGTAFEIDTQALPEGTAKLAVASDSGVDTQDHITTVTRPVIEGHASPGAWLRIDIDGTEYTTRADAAGTWSVQVTAPLAEGEYTPLVVVIDAAGNETEAEGDTFVVDLSGPEIDTPAGLVPDEEFDTGVDSEDGITANALPLIAGVAEAGAYVVLQIGDQTHAVVADDSGEWSVQITDPLDDGTYVPRVLYVDAAGNQVQELGVPLTIDTEAPDEATAALVHDEDNDTGDDSEDGITANNSPILRGTAEPGSVVLIDLNGTEFEVEVDDTGEWELTADGLDDGEYVPLITVTDVAGNVSDTFEGEPFVVITEAPEEAVGELLHDEDNDTGLDTEDGITANNTPILTGTAAPGSRLIVDLNGETFETTVDDDGVWELAIDTPLDDGDYVPVFTVIDVAGNVTESEGPGFTVDTEAPDADGVSGGLLHTQDNDTGVSADDGITNVSAPTLTGRAPALSLVRVEVDGTVYETEADDDGVWSLDLDDLSDGEYIPLITVVDVAGNESDPIEGEAFVVLTEADGDPSGGLDPDDGTDTGEPGDGITANPRPTLTGEASAGATVVIELGDFRYQTTADDTGAWRFQVPEALPDGEYIPLVSIVDVAGNETDPVELDPIIIDTRIDTISGGLLHEEDVDTGWSSTDGITNNVTPTLQGQAEADALVRVRLGALVFETTADSDGLWSIDVDTDLPNGTYTPLIEVTDLAGNTATAEGEPFTVVSTVAFEGYNVGQHINLLVGVPVNLNLSATGLGGLFEDYGGGLPDGLTLDEATGMITGTPTSYGTTWLASTTTDVAGNESTVYHQLTVSTASRGMNGRTLTSFNNLNEEAPSLFTGTDNIDRVNIYGATGDVFLLGAGDDIVQLFNQRYESDSPSLNFSLLDAGAGRDTVKISGKEMSFDFADYNNPDGAGKVLKGVEVIQFADKAADITVSVADLFHLQSDVFDVDGVHRLVTFLSSARNATATVNLEGLTQVGEKGQFGATGGLSSGLLSDQFTKYSGVYSDAEGDHLVSLLLQMGLTAA